MTMTATSSFPSCRRPPSSPPSAAARPSRWRRPCRPRGKNGLKLRAVDHLPDGPVGGCLRRARPGGVGLRRVSAIARRETDCEEERPDGRAGAEGHGGQSTRGPLLPGRRACGRATPSRRLHDAFTTPSRRPHDPERPTRFVRARVSSADSGALAGSSSMKGDRSITVVLCDEGLARFGGIHTATPGASTSPSSPRAVRERGDGRAGARGPIAAAASRAWRARARRAPAGRSGQHRRHRRRRLGRVLEQDVHRGVAVEAAACR